MNVFETEIRERIESERKLSILLFLQECNFQRSPYVHPTLFAQRGDELFSLRKSVKFAYVNQFQIWLVVRFYQSFV